jgi:hypothetical protein
LFVVFFSGSAVVAVGQLGLRTRPLLSHAGGGSLTPAATQIVTCGPVLPMFL